MGDRFVISLTTLPSRLPHIKPVINSIVKNNPDIDKLYICLPYGKVNPKHIPENTDIVKVIRCKDYGPITKILGCLEYENDPNTLILTLDDDVILTQNITKIFRKKSKKYSNAAISMSGWCYGTFPFYCRIVINNKKDEYVDWVQGVHGILYRRSFIDKKEILNFEKDQKVLFKNDDHKISAYLESKGIKRLVINKLPKKYFKNYKTVSSINPISGDGLKKNIFFFNDVWNICSYFSKKKIYKRNTSFSRSVVYLSLPIILIFILTFILLYLFYMSFRCYLVPSKSMIIEDYLMLIIIIYISFEISRILSKKYISGDLMLSEIN